MSSSIDTQQALSHFKTADPKMYRLLSLAIGSKEPLELPKPKKSKDFFGTISSSIISQQISTKAAEAVRGRVLELVGNITPEKILGVPEEKLRACGLSGQKTKYIRHNAAIWHEVPVGKFQNMTDEEIIGELTKLYGIGRWTAEMFLMFSLARPNVFSYGDLGLMQGLMQSYQYKPHWKRKITNTVDSWSPHKTLASLTLWFHKDNGPIIL